MKLSTWISEPLHPVLFLCSFKMRFSNFSTETEEGSFPLLSPKKSKASELIKFLILSISLQILLNSPFLVLNPHIGQCPSRWKGSRNAYFQKAPRSGRITCSFCSDTFTQGKRDVHSSTLHRTNWPCCSPSPCWAPPDPLLSLDRLYLPEGLLFLKQRGRAKKPQQTPKNFLLSSYNHCEFFMVFLHHLNPEIFHFLLNQYKYDAIFVLNS